MAACALQPDSLRVPLPCAGGACQLAEPEPAAPEHAPTSPTVSPSAASSGQQVRLGRLADMPEEILLRVGRWLGAADLRRFACTCRRIGRPGGSGRRLSIAQEAARRQVDSGCTARERGWVLPVPFRGGLGGGGIVAVGETVILTTPAFYPD